MGLYMKSRNFELESNAHRESYMMQTENDSMAGFDPGSRSLTLQTLSQTLQDAEDYLKNQEIRELWKGKQNEEKKKYARIYAKDGRLAD